MDISEQTNHLKIILESIENNLNYLSGSVKYAKKFQGAKCYMQVARQELDEMTHDIKVLITSICALSAIFEIDIDRTKIDKEVYNYILQSTDDLLIFINKKIQDFKQLNKEKKYYEGSAVLQNLASRPYKNFILKSYALKGCLDDNK